MLHCISCFFFFLFCLVLSLEIRVLIRVLFKTHDFWVKLLALWLFGFFYVWIVGWFDLVKLVFAFPLLLEFAYNVVGVVSSLNILWIFNIEGVFLLAVCRWCLCVERVHLLFSFFMATTRFSRHFKLYFMNISCVYFHLFSWMLLLLLLWLFMFFWFEWSKRECAQALTIFQLTLAGIVKFYYYGWKLIFIFIKQS